MHRSEVQFNPWMKGDFIATTSSPRRINYRNMINTSKTNLWTFKFMGPRARIITATIYVLKDRRRCYNTSTGICLRPNALCRRCFLTAKLSLVDAFMGPGVVTRTQRCGEGTASRGGEQAPSIRAATSTEFLDETFSRAKQL